jgi:hypothetical protein
MTCYDVDRFRAFVASDNFSTIYELPPDELHAMLLDDTLLMQFGFAFLRQVLFGEMSIPMRADSVEQRRERLTEQRARIEREAAERLARDDDEGGAYVDL